MITVPGASLVVVGDNLAAEAFGEDSAGCFGFDALLRHGLGRGFAHDLLEE